MRWGGTEGTTADGGMQSGYGHLKAMEGIHKKRTEPTVPKGSPSSVLRGARQAGLLKMDRFMYSPGSMTIHGGHLPVFGTQCMCHKG